jgi:hypothetical protein
MPDRDEIRDVYDATGRAELVVKLEEYLQELPVNQPVVVTVFTWAKVGSDALPNWEKIEYRIGSAVGVEMVTVDPPWGEA